MIQSRSPATKFGSPSNAGFALSEMMISTLIFAAVSMGLLMGFTALQRNYAATADFAINHADQMRISDYLAMDLRRAVAVETPAKNDTTIYIPAYYDGSGDPRTPTLDGIGGVYYGANGEAVKIHYYLSGGTVYRQQEGRPAVALATNVEDFVFDAVDKGKVVTTKITFNPTYTSGRASGDATAATAFYNTTLLRNARRDNQIAVY
jgi:type II secretory pathway component PulJ